MSLEFDALRRFLESQMRMSHIYQPLMLRTILQGGGTATARQIAAAFLAEDESQLEYYEAITNRMPGKVLRSHGVVERNRDRYSLASNVVRLSPSETDALIALCDAAITKFKAARGAAIWEHRAVGLGQIPGKLRYETLKRAGFRCELCGVPANERALDVDHIIPRKAGGADALENFQALCWLCNTNKGAGDDADFRNTGTLYAQKQSGCVFCEIAPERVIAENSLALAITDSFPVTPLHALIISRRHVADYFDLFTSEDEHFSSCCVRRDQRFCNRTAPCQPSTSASTPGPPRDRPSPLPRSPDSRREGDTPNPRGGERGAIPGKRFTE